MAKEKEGSKKAIEYHTESVYGVHHHYYNDPKVAEHMHAITGKKTLDPSHIPHLKAMGHEVNEVPVQGKQLQTGRGTSDGRMVARPPIPASQQPLPDDNQAIE